MVQWAKEDPLNERAFWVSVYPKLIPVQVEGEMNHKHTLVETLKALKG